MQNKENDAYRDGGIGYVKGRPVILLIIDIDKINYGTEPETIDQVSHSSPADHAQEDRLKNVPCSNGVVQKIKNHANGDQGNRGKKERLWEIIGAVEEPEGYPCIVDIDEVETSLEDRDRLMEQ